MADVAVGNLPEGFRTQGKPDYHKDWSQGATDYVSRYSLTPAHIPALIALAGQWGEGSLEDPDLYGPVHAWRALGQLRALAAVEPLLRDLDRIDSRHGDWFAEEFPVLFGLIGPPAIQSLAAYLADATHEETNRYTVSSGLREIALRYPEAREEVVLIITAELGKMQPELEVFNGLLVADLLDLEASESAETIERAYAAGAVDPAICGEWGVVRKQLGVEGLGLAPDETPPPRVAWEERASEPRERDPFLDPDPQLVAAARQQVKKAREKAKAKRQTSKRSRKRNQKRR